ncbi:MAG TPA: hypothetical protein VK943_11830 [Arenibaculum sp.]|nr:hypothetical protein [Arenibaculum sp.]
MTRFAAFLVMALALAACASEPADVPRTIAVSWCEQHRPGDEGCLTSARADHVRCITQNAGDYDQCRTGSLASPQTAGQPASGGG